MKSSSSPVTAQPVLMLAADHYNRYPGEQVTLFVRFCVPEGPGAMLVLAVPPVMQVESIVSESITDNVSYTSKSDYELSIEIPLERNFKAGCEYELQIRARIHTFYSDQYLLVEARLVSEGMEVFNDACLRLAVFGAGQYLKFLPELYSGDEFMSRFLMLFESFWKPVSQQIDQVDSYFDPDLTPPVFLPWLSSWFGLPVDETLPIDRQRALLKSAMSLFKRRGTREALQTYLELYSKGRVRIFEHHADNFVLGTMSELGTDIAFGRHNRPNSLQIVLRVPNSELKRTMSTQELYRKKIVELVRNFVPAHAYFEVHCRFVK